MACRSSSRTDMPILVKMGRSLHSMRTLPSDCEVRPCWEKSTVRISCIKLGALAAFYFSLQWCFAALYCGCPLLASGWCVKYPSNNSTVRLTSIDYLVSKNQIFLLAPCLCHRHHILPCASYCPDYVYPTIFSTINSSLPSLSTPSSLFSSGLPVTIMRRPLDTWGHSLPCSICRRPSCNQMKPRYVTVFPVGRQTREWSIHGTCREQSLCQAERVEKRRWM